VLASTTASAADAITREGRVTAALLLTLTQRGGGGCCCLYPKEAGGGGIAAAAAVNKWLIFSLRTHARRITHENR